jgi:hypothetical protein
MTIHLKLLAAEHIEAGTQIETLAEKELVPNMMLRRRLTRSARIAIYLANAIGFTQGRMILGSGLGEVKPTTNIFRALKDGSGIKATDFQNSVHNTPASYLSILYQNRAEILTLSDLIDNEKKVLQAGALKAFVHSEPIALFCVEALNFDGVEKMHCQDALESGTALLVQATDSPATRTLDADDRHPMTSAAKAHLAGQPTVIGVAL